MRYYDLKTTEGLRLFDKPSRYLPMKKELLELLKDDKTLSSLTFAKKVMFTHEIKSNNNVEGYSDDVEYIKKVIGKAEEIKNDSKRKRVLNLYRGYKYILEHKDINPESLKELYAILSEGLIDPSLIPAMGDYYREGPVYILKRGRLDDSCYTGVPYEEIEKYMEMYFRFLEDEKPDDIVDKYIKTQVLHYYFVYIHPYFDVNGRTSRTLSMWQILNEEIYPFIIFNRGIVLRGSEYDKVIEDVRKYRDLTYFINYMLDTVITELEKEYVMQVMADRANSRLEAVDYQTLIYFLTIKGGRSFLDFVALYNRFNDKKKVSEIFKTMIEPLLDKGVLEIERETHKRIGEENNVMLKLKHSEDISRDKVKRLIIR